MVEYVRGKGTRIVDDNRCVSCGVVIPEGKQYCANCGREEVKPRRYRRNLCKQVVEAYKNGMTNPYDLADKFEITPKYASWMLNSVGIYRGRPAHNYKLSERTQQVIKDLSQGVLSQGEIAQKHGVTKQWVSEAKKRYIESRTAQEEKTENITLVEVPCKVGDTVWRCLGQNKCDEWFVDKIHVYVTKGQIDWCLVCSSKNFGWGIFYKNDKDVEWSFEKPKAEFKEKQNER